MRTGTRLRQEQTGALARSERGEAGGVQIRGLRVVYQTPEGELPAVSGVDLDLPAGTMTGLVGESGSGKSTLALAMLNAVPRPGRISEGRITLPGVVDVTRLRGRALRQVRGEALGYVFQASQNSLNPLKRVGAQLLDLGASHGVTDRRVLLSRARELCEMMGLDPVRTLSAYQHELSGGMRQRVGIVFALILNPHVLVLDEPTTALDMISQATVLEIVRKVHRERNLSTLIITHDVSVAAEMADSLAVMYGGRLVEKGPTQKVLQDPRHPYTAGLIAAMPRISGDIDEARPLPGRPPDLVSLLRQGCVFRDRCPLSIDRCAEAEPALVQLPQDGATAASPHGSGGARVVACHVRAPAPSADRP
jgi:peptide/nickel transport system ATP-binding protein